MTGYSSCGRTGFASTSSDRHTTIRLLLLDVKREGALPATARKAKIAAASLAGLTSLALAGLAVSGPAMAGTATAAHKPAASRSAAHQAPSFQASVVIDGANLSHSYTPAGGATAQTEPLTLPDDITVLGHDLFTAFQNGVGPQGQPSSDGNEDSTVVEFTANGQVLNQWDLVGKCDGLTADTHRGILIATVNEDANSSVYTIAPGARPAKQVAHYRYNMNPLLHHGGTDAISVYHGKILVSASAPGTLPATPPAPQPTFPAVYVLKFHPGKHLATLKPLFYDEASATVANVNATNHGQQVQLALIDPDSNEVVPASAPRFAGDFMLTSQGDQEQIFVQHTGKPGRHGKHAKPVSHGKLGSRLTVLSLSASVDDTAWITSPDGAVFAANTSGGTIDMVTGSFRPGTVFAAVTPCDSNNAPSTCPGPGFPANYVGQVNPWTGQLTTVPLSGATLEPQGMVFVAAGGKKGWH
jgi:hypothetical protein